MVLFSSGDSILIGLPNHQTLPSCCFSSRRSGNRTSDLISTLDIAKSTNLSSTVSPKDDALQSRSPSPVVSISKGEVCIPGCSFSSAWQAETIFRGLYMHLYSQQATQAGSLPQSTLVQHRVLLEVFMALIVWVQFLPLGLLQYPEEGS